MNIGNSIVLIVGSLMLVGGCDKGGADASVEESIATGEVAGGGKITIEKKTAERSCKAKIGGVEKTVSFCCGDGVSDAVRHTERRIPESDVACR